LFHFNVIQNFASGSGDNFTSRGNHTNNNSNTTNSINNTKTNNDNNIENNFPYEQPA
jgi:hypothetical protein